MKILALFTLLLASLPGWAQESHTVQANQTLYSIARLYNISVDQLRSWNNLDNETIRVGQALIVKPATKMSVVNPGLNPFLYTVRTGDTLTGLSVKFDTSVDTLRRINGVDSDQGLYVGQRLFIRRPVGIVFYTVQPGDTLGHVSALFDLAAQDLKAINQLASDTLVPGKVLRVFKPAEVPLTHTVAATDTPAGVAALYGLSVAELQRLNGADALNFRVGQVLKLRPYASASQNIFQSATEEQSLAQKAAPVSFPAPAKTYVVQKGDTMLKVTRTFGVRLDQLLAWNGLTADSGLRIGQVLNVAAPGSAPAAAPEAAPAAVATPVALVAAPPLPKADTTVSFPADPAPAAAPAASAASGDLPAFRDEDQAKIKWDSYVVLDRAIPVFEWNNDYYYWTHPGEVSQPNRGYYENSWPSPLDAYQKARQLLTKFDALIAQRPPLSSILKGYTFVLDPGHGGLDPGAIVKSVDSNGKDAYLTEHEYVYDISLRVYALLKRHGADVRLTVLAPNHLIRDTQPANNTLINEKNQVYNDLALNQSDDNDAWPNGTQKGLDKRVAIADRVFRNVPAGKRVFLSIHADNNPFSPLGTGVYALETRDGSVDSKSLTWGQKLLPYLGADAYARSQNLAVLRGNDADYKVLLEVHNLASEEQSQAMRAGSSRQLSAQKIVRGILEAFRS
jgi:LysM repeat protein/N-acetylmuramoyl-L-alanine amidase